MDIKIDSLIPFDTLRTDIEYVFSVVEKNGNVVLLKDNRPAYIVLKYDVEQVIDLGSAPKKEKSHTLQDAMRIVLLDVEDKTMLQKLLMRYMTASCIYRKMARRRSILRLEQDADIILICLRLCQETISN
jgi:hypothetical protein